MEQTIRGAMKLNKELEQQLSSLFYLQYNEYVRKVSRKVAISEEKFNSIINEKRDRINKEIEKNKMILADWFIINNY